MAVICFLAIVFDGLDSALFGTLLPVIMKDMNLGPAEAGEAAAAWVRQAMLDGLAPLIDPVPVVVDVTVGRTWAGD